MNIFPTARKIGIDTSIFIYHYEQSSQYGPLVGATLKAIENGEVLGVTSLITLLEITVVPIRLGRPEVADTYEALIANMPNMTIAPINRPVARIAAELRAKYALRTPDALQIASCLYGGADTFLTNDRRLRTISELEVRVLVDFA